MATLSERLPFNAPGVFYVDSTCIDCDACRSIAPMLFERDDESGFTYVTRQPQTDEEYQLALDAIGACCTDSIGEDGDKA